MPIPNVISTPATTIQIGLEPTLNALQSLLLLTQVDDLSGLGDWVIRTDQALSQEQRQRHFLVMIGFYNIVVPQRSWSNFGAYLQSLKSMTPHQMREKLMQDYLKMPCKDGAPVDLQKAKEIALASQENYLQFLRERFDETHIFPEVEKQAFNYLQDPPLMKELIVSHVQAMWDQYLASEWQQVKGMLQESVEAFRRRDYSGLSKLEAARLITGHKFDEEKWAKHLDAEEQIIFVPNPHIGPYTGVFHVEDKLVLFFGARHPDGVFQEAPDLSRAEILVRLSALADDSRLRILKYISENGEQRSQDVMQALDLSQSAASRHLKQLSATGYLNERRCEGAKCYDLNPERLDDTLQAIRAFLLG